MPRYYIRFKTQGSFIEAVKNRLGEGDMSEVGRALHSTLLSPRPKLHLGKCQNCGYALELYEMDVKKSMKVMKCERCGLLHYYKKDIVGKWRLQKAAKSELAR